MDEKITNTVLALSIGSIVIILSIMVAKIIIIIKYLENTSRGSLAISIPSVIRQSFKAPFFNYPFYCLILNKGWVDIRRTSAFFLVHYHHHHPTTLPLCRSTGSMRADRLVCSLLSARIFHDYRQRSQNSTIFFLSLIFM